MLTGIIAAIAIGVSAWFFWPESDPNQNWCEEKTIAEVIGCDEVGEAGCAYKMGDGSLDANGPGFKVGDKLKVCRSEKPAVIDGDLE